MPSSTSPRDSCCLRVALKRRRRGRRRGRRRRRRSRGRRRQRRRPRRRPRKRRWRGPASWRRRWRRRKQDQSSPSTRCCASGRLPSAASAGVARCNLNRNLNRPRRALRPSRSARARCAPTRTPSRPCRKLDRCGQRETSPSAARGDEWPRRAEAWGSLYRHDLALKQASGEPAERGLRRPPAGRGLSHIASRRRPSPRRPTGSDPASASRSSSRAGAAPCRQTGQAPHEARAAFLVPSWCLLGAKQASPAPEGVPGAVPSCGQPRQVSLSGPRWPAIYRACL